jgi:ATP-dependent DNA ligase
MYGTSEPTLVCEVAFAEWTRKRILRQSRSEYLCGDPPQLDLRPPWCLF